MLHQNDHETLQAQKDLQFMINENARLLSPAKPEDDSKAKNIHRIANFQVYTTAYVTAFDTNTADSFHLMENEVTTLNAIKAEMAGTQDRNWLIIQEKHERSRG